MVHQHHDDAHDVGVHGFYQLVHTIVTVRMVSKHDEFMTKICLFLFINLAYRYSIAHWLMRNVLFFFLIIILSLDYISLHQCEWQQWNVQVVV